MRLGNEAAAYVSGHFIKPIQLKSEKVYCPYLLMNKKRYAGLLWTKPDSFDKMSYKGVDTIRRDNCGLVKKMVHEVLDDLLVKGDANLALKSCKGMISDLLQNKVDISLLVMMKGLGNRFDPN